MKKKTLKKFVTSLVAGALVLSSSVVAFADEVDEKQGLPYGGYIEIDPFNKGAGKWGIVMPPPSTGKGGSSTGCDCWGGNFGCLIYRECNYIPFCRC